jgi:hypothetical protein
VSIASCGHTSRRSPGPTGLLQRCDATSSGASNGDRRRADSKSEGSTRSHNQATVSTTAPTLRTRASQTRLLIAQSLYDRAAWFPPRANAVDLRGSCHFDRREKSFRPRTIQRFLASLEMTELPARSLNQQHCLPWLSGKPDATMSDGRPRNKRRKRMAALAILSISLLAGLQPILLEFYFRPYISENSIICH